MGPFTSEFIIAHDRFVSVQLHEGEYRAPKCQIIQS